MYTVKFSTRTTGVVLSITNIKVTTNFIDNVELKIFYLFFYIVNFVCKTSKKFIDW